MTQTPEWLKAPRRYAGLLLMGLFVLASVASGVLAFAHIMTAETVYGVMIVCFFLLGLPGFVLHMVTVARNRRSANGA